MTAPITHQTTLPLSHPTYTIATVHDFLAVPEDRRAVCLREFGVWVDMMTKVPKIFEGIKVMVPTEFVWIDDGLHTMTVSVQSDDTYIHVAHGVMREFT